MSIEEMDTQIGADDFVTGNEEAGETRQTDPELNGDLSTQSEQTHESELLPAPPKEPAQDNAAFAAKRREQERNDERESIKMQTFKQTVGAIANPNTGKPFESIEEWDSYKNDIELSQSAEKFSLSKQEYSALTQKMRDDILNSDPAIVELKRSEESFKQVASEAIFTKDLSDIKAAYPDEKAKGIDDLGENFGKMRCLGIDVITAYEAIRKSRTQSGAKMPPSTGDISIQSTFAKDFFTSDEVDKMTRADIKKNYDTIKKSMANW